MPARTQREAGGGGVEGRGGWMERDAEWRWGGGG